MIILGIDPGSRGAVTTITDRGTPLEIVGFANKTEKEFFELFKRIASASYPFGWELTSTSAKSSDLFALVEKVHSIPGDTPKTAFSFGRSMGLLEMALIANSIPYEYVSPLKWQTEMGSRTGGDKKISQRKAEQLFPDTKITQYAADSALIAEYGRRVYLKRNRRGLENDF